jgi:2-methylaconitate cis-trans-isomerase PrpF
MSKMIRVPCVIYRGGTSKAVFLKENHLPSDPAKRDEVICALFGSPDKRQIDGLGGAEPLTSKVAIIGPPSRPDADVDYTFGQVDIVSPTIGYNAVCGNISAAVGPYAIDEGFVKAGDSPTKVRIHSTNIGRIIEASVPVEANEVRVSGDYSIDGVPGTGAKIELNWADTAGANTGTILPTGNPQDSVTVAGVGTVSVSIVDVGNPGVFVRAEDLGLTGTEGPEEIDNNHELIEKCNVIARTAGDKIGATAYVTIVAPPQSYRSPITDRKVIADDVDYLVRMIYMGKLHKAFAASQTICSGAASVIPGTTVNEVRTPSAHGTDLVRIGHPAGISEVSVQAKQSENGILFDKIGVCRTARRLLEGYAFVRKDVF